MKFLRAMPLALTAIRLLLGPAFMVAHRYGVAVEWLVLMVVAALVTDWLDGFAARRWNAISAAGKLLDPFADALFCMLVFVDFAQHGLMPLWIVIVLIIREGLVTFVLRPFAFWRGVVVAAGWMGKFKTGFQFAAMIVVLVLQEPRIAELLPLQIFVRPLFIAVLGLSVLSGAGYVRDVAKAAVAASPCAGRGCESGK